jgi:hypothetical protein
MPRVFRITAQEEEERETDESECRDFYKFLVRLKHFHKTPIIVGIRNDNNRYNKYNIFQFYHIFLFIICYDNNMPHTQVPPITTNTPISLDISIPLKFDSI